MPHDCEREDVRYPDPVLVKRYARLFPKIDKKKKHWVGIYTQIDANTWSFS